MSQASFDPTVPITDYPTISENEIRNNKYSLINTDKNEDNDNFIGDYLIEEE